MPRDGQSHTLRSILLSVRDRLAAVTGIDQQFVRIVASDSYRVCHEPTALYLRPFGPKPDTDVGVGRRARPCYRVLRVYLQTRSSEDQTGFDEFALTPDARHLELEDTVFDALDEFWPTEGATVLTIEPLHPLGEGQGKPVRESADDIGFITSYLDFQVRAVLWNQNPAPSGA